MTRPALPRLFFLLGLASVLTGCPRALPPRIEPPKAAQLALPATGAYTGAYMDFGEKEDAVSVEAIEEFEKMVGKRQAIVASSSYWGEQSFPAANIRLIARHGSLPLIFWSPWDRPYEENRGPDRYSLTSILEGKHDAYIDRWGDEAKAFAGPMVVSFANEPNGNWFPWSGFFYGAGKKLSKGAGFEGPDTYRRAFRYVVDRVRARGARNVQWVLHLMNYPYPFDMWNLAAEYDPGSEYCDWVGFSLYGPQYNGDRWGTFTPLLAWPYQTVSELHPAKPVMVVEWGVGEFPKKGSKAAWISEALATMRSPEYNRIKAIVFWHERWQNKDGSYSNLRVNSSPDALQAYRDGIADPYWLDRPIWK